MRTAVILFFFLTSTKLFAQLDSIVLPPSRNWTNDSLLITQNSLQSACIGEGKILQLSALFQEAYYHLGTPYQWGGRLPGGFDCSGFVKHCFDQVLNLNVPSSSSEYATFGDSVNLNTCAPGDVICFSGSDKNLNKIGHIGIITEVSRNDIFFIHSATHGGILVDKLSTKYYRERLIGIRRIIP